MTEQNKKSKLAEREEQILKIWQDNNIFQKSLLKDSPKGEFVFFDGPPFATGLPHFGHILAGTMKDFIGRYKTMQGYHVPRKWGWDCHGLPIENIVEQELGLKSRKDIETLGLDKFNEIARSKVFTYVEDWKKIVPRMGRFVDMDNDYKTLDHSYMESVWNIFKELNNKGLIYEGFKSMHLCPKCETTLSNFEVAQGYKDVTDISVTVKFELIKEQNTFLLAWTTTPWTLAGNIALAVGSEIDYIKVQNLKNKNQDIIGKTTNEKYILSESRALSVLKDYDYEIIEKFKGKSLVGLCYKPVFNYYNNEKNRENGYKVYLADFVTVESGTGIVHIAPAFGEDDMNLGVKEKLPFIQHVGFDGKFKDEVIDFAGKKVKPIENPQGTDIEVIKYLAKNQSLFSKEKIIHSYPHCSRCDTPLLNYATTSWFVNVIKIKDQLIEANKKIKWVPQEIGEGRFGKWLEGARDWSISRTRFWGCPIPVWKCSKCESKEFIGSIEEIKQRSGEKEIDMHRPFIDKIILKCKCGKDMHRIPEVFDCWFESGAMPYGQSHYPFNFSNGFNPKENKKFPADFIAEGLDQTRGWFYSMLVLSVALYGESSYKNVIVNGIVLAENGQKMSKRLKNYTDPMELVDLYGADAIRYYLLSSSAMRAQDLRFSNKGTDEVVKKVIIRLQNTLSFFEMYGESEIPLINNQSQNPLDKWIFARLKETAIQITKFVDGYELDKGTWPITSFVDDISTWYLRRSRDRFKSEDLDDLEDRNHAISTIKTIILQLSKLLAPSMPFLAEDMYLKITKGNYKESVHLESWPTELICDMSKEELAILEDMKETRNISSLGLDARVKFGIKVRQPLQSLTIKNEKLKDKENLLNLIKDEINVKKIIFDKNIQSDVELDANITSDLKEEGFIRDFIRSIQEMRKSKNLKAKDIIRLFIETDSETKKMIEKFEKEILKAIKVKTIEFTTVIEGKEFKYNDLTLQVSIGFP